MKKITDSNIALITEKMKSDHAKVVFIALETAMRPSEIINLKFADIDLENRNALLRNTKFGKDHTVDLSDKAIEIINSIEKTESDQLFNVNYDSVSDDLGRSSSKLGLGKLSFIDIRYEAIERLSKIMSINDLARNIGHGHFYSYAHLEKYYS